MTDPATPNDATDQAPRAAISRLFDDTRRRLVETGTRNRLVHVNRANTRGHVLNIVNERSNDVHAILSSGKAMRFLAIGKDKDEARGAITLADVGQEGFDEDHFRDAQLETRLGPDSLQKKLLKIAREAKTAEEESGVNILYLAMGFLTWLEEDAPDVPREAPLVLFPVELVRNARTSTYDVRAREDDMMTNLPLQQRLKDDFGIVLPELEVGEGWQPGHYFAQVGEVMAQRQRWKIEADGIQLGFFSFSKLLMYLDLAVDAWPGTYVLAVECDGASYHGALWARERDRLRQDVLEVLGWRFHRIWSTDWFYDRASEIERLRIALAEAHDAAERGIQIPGANRARPVVEEEPELMTDNFQLPEVVARQMPTYLRAHFPVAGRDEPHEVPRRYARRPGEANRRSRGPDPQRGSRAAHRGLLREGAHGRPHR